MSDNWSRQEVEATVADYFVMLSAELSGQSYNKSEHRRALAALLGTRSDGAIERKHQNVSAILIELGFAYVGGYKPLSNYQQLLFDVVFDRLSASSLLQAKLEQQVSLPAVVPAVEDIMAALVAAPAPDQVGATSRYARLRERPAARRGIDYLALEASNHSLGAAGEEFVVRFEIARLELAGASRLASRVERVSATQGDGLGFDVLSFEVSGRERFIEVKTTAYGVSTPFYVTPNEVDVSFDKGEQFQLYRPFHFRRAAKLYVKPGPLQQGFRLEPSQFRAFPT